MSETRRPPDTGPDPESTTSLGFVLKSSDCPVVRTSVRVERRSSKYAGKSASAVRSSIARKEARDWTRSPARSRSSVLRVT